ncbi:MAG TPA: FAD-dependent oxidoreductase [Acidimicrobiales bacterium]
MARAEVIVVGAGVVGLTCALRLAEAGHPVRVVAREPPPNTTSAVAAAVWYPYRAYPFDLVLGWARTGYATFASLAAAEPAAGVRLRSGVELVREEGPDPWWAGAVPDLVKASDVPPGYAAGWRFTSPVVDMSRYLPWLVSRLAAHGVVPEVAVVDDLGTLGPVVVDCAGVGARELAPDPAVVPVRGQVVVVEQVGLEEWLVDDGDGASLTYVVPRLDDVVVGGTADEGAEDLTADPATAAAILERATALVPALAGARIVGHKVGLRPGRPTVRLEAEQREGATVVHCYGHGGAGVTLSWGCAADVVGLVDPAARAVGVNGP